MSDSGDFFIIRKTCHISDIPNVSPIMQMSLSTMLVFNYKP